MAAKIQVKLNHEGIRAMLNSGEVDAAVRSAAETIAAKAGDGFEVTERQERSGNRTSAYSGRVGYGVYTANYDAMMAEATDKVLTRAVQSCR